MSKVNSSCVNCALTAFTATDDLDLAVEAWGRALSDVGLGTSDADFLRNGLRTGVLRSGPVGRVKDAVNTLASTTVGWTG
ncbi:hypothetical protein SRABI91_04198 [Rhodococcoides fascians]|nr:hypothetical protein SRABI91_04198 [Rhodococcus fascians]